MGAALGAHGVRACPVSPEEGLDPGWMHNKKGLVSARKGTAPFAWPWGRVHPAEGLEPATLREVGAVPPPAQRRRYQRE